jgi:hypothetical protein
MQECPKVGGQKFERRRSAKCQTHPGPALFHRIGYTCAGIRDGVGFW